MFDLNSSWKLSQLRAEDAENWAILPRPSFFLLAKKYFNFIIIIMIVVAVCCHLHCITIKIVAKLFPIYFFFARCTQDISHALTQTSKLVEQMNIHIKDIYTIYLYKYICAGGIVCISVRWYFVRIHVARLQSEITTKWKWTCGQVVLYMTHPIPSDLIPM